MKVLFPIAGRGSRFKKEAETNAEFFKPKPLISVRGYPMIRWATGSLPFVEHKGQKKEGNLVIRASDLIFVALQEHEEEFQIERQLRDFYGDGIQVIFISETTRGAAETALCAKKFINISEPLLISDSDHFFDGQALLRGIQENSEIDGLMPVFQVPDGNPKWSFSRLDNAGCVDLVAEKQPISQWANIGAYFFGKGSDFVKAAEDMIKNDEYVNNEFYLAPVYNKIIQNGGKIKLVYPKYMYGLGTPADLTYFLEHTDYMLD